MVPAKPVESKGVDKVPSGVVADRGHFPCTPKINMNSRHGLGPLRRVYRGTFGPSYSRGAVQIATVLPYLVTIPPAGPRLKSGCSNRRECPTGQRLRAGVRSWRACRSPTGAFARFLSDSQLYPSRLQFHCSASSSSGAEKIAPRTPGSGGPAPWEFSCDVGCALARALSGTPR
jgi:hypothetical protein